MAKKDGMYLYNDWLEPFEKLEREELGELIIAMMKYFINGEKPPRFKGLLGMAQDFIFPQIDRSMEYARLGSRGGIASTRKKSKREEPQGEEPSEEEMFDEALFSAIAAEPSAVEVSEVREEELPPPPAVKMKSEAEMFEEMKLEDHFNRFWRVYPRKTGRVDAKKAFKKLNPDKELLLQMVEAVERQKATKRWQKSI